MPAPLDALCRSGANCSTCRDPSKGPWRDQVAAAYAVPADWPACPKGLPMGWAPAGRCERCGADWHALADCPIPEDYKPTPESATAGGCGCDGSQTRDAGDRPAD